MNRFFKSMEKRYLSAEITVFTDYHIARGQEKRQEASCKKAAQQCYKSANGKIKWFY